MHTQEIQNLINTALHAPATGSIVIQGALFLDIISRMENAEQQNAELLDVAKEAVRSGILYPLSVAIAKAGDKT